MITQPRIEIGPTGRARKIRKTDEATEVAAKIDAHLRRMEKLRKTDESGLYNAGARRDGRYIKVTYVTYQGTTSLCLDAAKKYLSMIEKHLGSKDYRHHEALCGSQWEHDTTGLRTAARSRSNAAYEEKDRMRKIANAIAEAERDAVGMVIAAKLLESEARNMPLPDLRRVVRDCAREIRKDADRRIMKARSGQ